MIALVVVPVGIDTDIEVYTFQKWEKAINYMENMFYEDMNNEFSFKLNKNDTWVDLESGEAKLCYNDGSYYMYTVTYVSNK